MQPTFNSNGDLVFIDMISYRLLGRHYKKGDVIIAICPTDPEKSNLFIFIIYFIIIITSLILYFLK